MIQIDKSKFTAEQLAMYEELVAIGKADVNPAANKEKMEDDLPPETPAKKKPTEKAEVEDVDTKKSDAPEQPAVPDFVTDAIKKSEEFIARAEKQEQTEIAKKYAVLGAKPEELGEQLYNLKKSDPAMYDSCISMLDNQVSMIEKSAMFAEIGKSTGSTSAGGSAVSKADAKAQEIMKADPSISYEEAVAKAWDDPVLMAEYDAEYSRK